MKKVLLYLILSCVCFSLNACTQKTQDYHLPDAVITELNRLGEAYKILDQFALDVWKGWDNYSRQPVMLTFQNGLRILLFHPEPPADFVIYEGMRVHDMPLYLDTTSLNRKFQVKLPLQAGGGLIPLGKSTIVSMIFTPSSPSTVSSLNLNGENTILGYIHELMHCFQPSVMKFRFGNLRINPNLTIALYKDIEGRALQKAYEQTTKEKAVPFLKDFCVARHLLLQELANDEINSHLCDEFREGEAVYAEMRILQNLRNGFETTLKTNDDPEYHHFKDIDTLMNRYIKNLESSAGNTLDIYGKNYWYGGIECFLLQRFFPGWQDDFMNGMWLHQIIGKNINLSSADNTLSFDRFKSIYGIDSLKSKHEKVIAGRDETYRMFQERKGLTYIIDAKPVSQYLTSLVDKTARKYNLGVMYMFPDGITGINFDSVSVSLEPGPVEINQLFYLKVIDTESAGSGEPFNIKYESFDEKGFYRNAIITTPLFTLKAPKVSVVRTSNR
jgi:hypothetical protein